MRLLYTIGIYFYNWLITLAAIRNSKAALWKTGRKNWKSQLTNISQKSPIYWFHSASLGEFEQGRPLIEAIKKQEPETFILLTFFSPSGYEVRKNYAHADLIMYLPSDTIKNARYFIDKVNPQKVFFIKYEFWFNYIHFIHKKQIELYSISTIFRQNQIFFKPYGIWFRKHLKYFDHFFVQNQTSGELLHKIGIDRHTLSGDTRYDRVKDIAMEATEIPEIAAFAKNNFTIVAGSTWNEENEMLISLANKNLTKCKIIIAPHELHEKTYLKIEKECIGKVARLSQSNIEDTKNAQILIIDSIGLLSKIYRYGQVALIGGGFGKGIHNVLEPAVYGVPVMFGPNYKKFHEASTMVNKEIAFPITESTDFEFLIQEFSSNHEYLSQKSKETSSFVGNQLGATQIILLKTVKTRINK